MCVNLCASNIYAWTNYFEQIFLCPGPCGFGLLDTLLFHVSLFLSVNMQSWTRTRSILRLRNPCVLTSRYLLICPTLKRGLICAGKGQQLNSVLTILKIQLKKIFWAFWVFFTEHSIRPTYPPTSLLKLLLIPELVPKYLSKVKVMSKYSALHQLDPRKMGAEGQTSLMQLFDGDNR